MTVHLSWEKGKQRNVLQTWKDGIYIPMYRFGPSWLWSWGLDGDTVRSAGLGDVVQGTDCCPASAAAQLEQVAHFSERPFSRFYLQNRNKKFYLVEFFKEI